jgi:predicted RNase H-like HicB family nuclease
VVFGRKCQQFKAAPPRADTIEELLTNLYEAVEACLSVDLEQIEISENDKVLELAV